ncbi:hypothetical protein IMSAG049_00425 [Clostridiales bacterium]|nr:hypothetical protein IMSAG049_00425 [Clostridiales bacterium]
MKKYFVYTAAVVSAMALMSFPAMASGLSEVSKTKTEAKTEEAEPQGALPAEEPETIGYLVINGTIKEVKENNGGMSISVESKERGEIIFNQDSNCIVIENNELKTIKDLKAGMEVSIVMDELAPMTMSLPPQTNGALAFVVNGEEPSFTEVAKFDNELSSDTLKLNIDDSVKIMNINGAKKIFTADDIKGSTSMVVYGASTKSIPAQTTPYIVVILDAENEEIPADNTVQELPAEKEEPKEITNVPLRDTVTKLGYTIDWKSNDAPIVLTKGESSAEIIIGDNKITVEDDMVYELSSAPALIDGITYVPSDILDILK